MAGDYYLDEVKLGAKPLTTHLFLAEGQAEVGLIEACLRGEMANPVTTTILCFKGIKKMKGHAETFVKLLFPGKDDLDRIVGVGLIADSEDDPDGRINAVIECAKAFGFERCGRNLRDRGMHDQGGRRFAFSLSPSNTELRRIEDLILNEIAQAPLMTCIRKSLECISLVKGHELEQKAQVQMYLSAAMDNSASGIRTGFQARVFNTDHAAYERHRSTIRAVLEGPP